MRYLGQTLRQMIYDARGGLKVPAGLAEVLAREGIIFPKFPAWCPGRKTPRVMVREKS